MTHSFYAYFLHIYIYYNTLLWVLLSVKKHSTMVLWSNLTLGPFSLGVKNCDIRKMEVTVKVAYNCTSLVQLLGNFHRNFAIFTPKENGPFN